MKRKEVTLLRIGIGILALAPLAAGAEEKKAIPGPMKEMATEPLGGKVVQVVSGGVGVTQQPIPPAPGHAIEFAVDAAQSASSWRIEVQTTAGAILASIEVAPGVSTDSLWTPVFRTDEQAIRIRVSGPAADQAPRVTLARVAAKIAEVAPQATCGEPDSKPFTDPSVAAFASLGPAVARLRFPLADGWYTCTSFVVGRRYVLTNHHCIATDAVARKAKAVFGQDSPNHAGIEVDVKSFVAGKAALDYALLELSAEPPAGTGSVAISADARPVPDSALVVIGHPGGRSKEVSLKGCSAARSIPAGGPFDHYCDTETGSSGSPVFEVTTGRLVGLHHGGIEGCGQQTWGNEAIAMDAIAADLKSRVAANVYGALVPAQPGGGQ